jgi:hypothetical protein
VNGHQRDDPTDPLTPAERRLGEHLALLREVPQSPSATLAPRIVRSARWQLAVRAPLLAIAHLAAAVGDGVRVLIGGPPR